MIIWPSVYIIVLNWDNWQDTVECLNSIYKITYPNYNLVVVDNGSSNDSVARIIQWAEERKIKVIYCEKNVGEKGENKKLNDNAGRDLSNKRLILIQSGENLGYAGGNNVGIRYALKNKADYVLILNNDTVVSPGFLEPLVLSAEREKTIGIVGGKILYYDNPNKIQTIGGGLYNPWLGRAKYITTTDIQVDYIAGCMMLIKKTLLEDIGLLDESYFLYFEDTDFNFEAKNKGWKIVVNAESIIWHKHSNAIGGNISPLKDYYGTRNAFFFTFRFYKKYLPSVLIMQGMKAVGRLLTFRFKNFISILKTYKDFKKLLDKLSNEH